MKRRSVLAAILLLGAALRLPALLHAGLWRDEAYLYVELSAPAFGEFFHRLVLTEYFPPLYFLLMYVWSAFTGFSEAALKFPSFACSILTIAAVYRLGRVAHDARTGLLAAFLCAIMPVSIAPAADARPYSLLALIVTLLATSFLKLREHATSKRFVETALLCMLAVYTHYLALLSVIAFATLAAVDRAGLKHATRNAFAVLAGAIPFLFWLPIFSSQIAIGIPWKSPASLTAKAAYFGASLMQSIPTGTWFVLVILALLAAVVFFFGSMRPHAAILGGIFILVLLLEAAAGLPDARYVYPFYGLFAVLEASVIMSTADILKRRGNMIWRAVAIAGTAAAAVTALALGGATAIASATPHSGIRTLFAAAAPGPGEFSIVAPDYLAATFSYYGRDLHAPFIGFVRIWDPQIFRASGYQRDWNDPRALQRAECVIAVLAARYRSFHYLADSTAHNQWHVPYAKTWQLLGFLKANYPLEGLRSFAGSDEKISDYRFKGRILARKRQCGAQQQR